MVQIGEDSAPRDLQMRSKFFTCKLLILIIVIVNDILKEYYKRTQGLRTSCDSFNSKPARSSRLNSALLHINRWAHSYSRSQYFWTSLESGMVRLAGGGKDGAMRGCKSCGGCDR